MDIAQTVTRTSQMLKSLHGHMDDIKYDWLYTRSTYLDDGAHIDAAKIIKSDLLDICENSHLPVDLAKRLNDAVRTIMSAREKTLGVCVREGNKPGFLLVVSDLDWLYNYYKGVVEDPLGGSENQELDYCWTTLAEMRDIVQASLKEAFPSAPDGRPPQIVLTRPLRRFKGGPRNLPRTTIPVSAHSTPSWCSRIMYSGCQKMYRRR